MDLQAAPQNDIGLSEGCLDVAVDEQLPADGVGWQVLVHQRLARLARGGDVQDRVQLVEVHDDEFGRILGYVRIGGDHHRNRLADIADHTTGQRGLQSCFGFGRHREGHPDRYLDLWKVAGGEHPQHAFEPEGFGGVHSEQAGMR